MGHARLICPFYPSGSIARVGQAKRPLVQRLTDYEPHTSGWFAFRWVALIPFGADQVDLITPMEDDLIASLRPPENTKGIV